MAGRPGCQARPERLSRLVGMAADELNATTFFGNNTLITFIDAVASFTTFACSGMPRHGNHFGALALGGHVGGPMVPLAPSLLHQVPPLVDGHDLVTLGMGQGGLANLGVGSMSVRPPRCGRWIGSREG